MEGNDMEAVSVEDVGECVATIFNKPKLYAGKTIGLTAGRISMKTIVDSFNKYFENRKFEDREVWDSIGVTIQMFVAINCFYYTWFWSSTTQISSKCHRYGWTGYLLPPPLFFSLLLNS